MNHSALRSSWIVRLAVLFLVVAGVCSGAWGQEARAAVCPEPSEATTRTGDFTLETQADVNTLEGVTRIEGNLTITGDEILDLASLRHLVETTGSFRAKELSAQEELSGFDCLRHAQLFEIEDNGTLVRISGFNILQSVPGDVNVMFNGSLMFITGFKTLKEVRSLRLSFNESLNRIEGFEALERVDGLFRIDHNPSLVNIPDFNALEHVGESVSIRRNDLQDGLAGFENVLTIDGQLAIEANASLTSIAGFYQLREVASLSIDDNPVLETVSGFGNLEALSGDFSIENNAALTSIAGFHRIQAVGGELFVTNNPSLEDAPSFRSRPPTPEVITEDLERVPQIAYSPPQQGGVRDADSAAAQAEALLAQGATRNAEMMLIERLEADPVDYEARFALGAVRVLLAVEQLTQETYRYGFGSGTAGETGALFGIEVPLNPTPEPVSYADFRDSLKGFYDALVHAEATLEPLAELAGSEAGAMLKLRLNLGLIRLDFDGDGVPGEQISALLFELRNLAFFDPEGIVVQPIPIAFDLGDVFWLRAYLHLLAATVDTILAYDAQTLWDATAHLFYPQAVTPYPYLQQLVDPDVSGFDLTLIADAIALIHLLNLPVEEPERLAQALEHLEATVALSRATWEVVITETDNEREWLPNPEQTGVVPSEPGGPPIAVTKAMIDNWLDLLDETQAILEGRKLIPYWRVTDGRGINLRRVFLEPQPFDLLLWIQGVAVAPYIEEGELTQGDTWLRIVNAFDGQFLPIAFWFN